MLMLLEGAVLEIDGTRYDKPRLSKVDLSRNVFHKRAGHPSELAINTRIPILLISNSFFLTHRHAHCL